MKRPIPLLLALACLLPQAAAADTAGPGEGAPPPSADAIEPPAPDEDAPAGPRVELVFVGVGDDPYSLYGHAAMLVLEDPEAPIEDAELFNFGVTAFTEDGYVQKFLGGRVQFWGDSRRYGRQLEKWREADRTVVRRVVDLDPEATARLITHLRLDITRERRDYVYDTFRENCATRLRDYLDLYSGGAVFAALGPIMTARSFRDDVREAYAGLPPLLMLTEVVPGVELDRPRTLWERAYLPAALVDGLSMVTTARGPLLGETTVDHRRAGPDPRAGWIHIGQALVAAFGVLFALGAVFAPRLGRRARGALLAAWALGAAGLGALLVLVGLGSDWPDMQRNWLLLAVPPTDLCLLVPAIALLRRRPAAGSLTRGYLALRIGSTALLIALTPVWPAITGPLVPRLAALAGVLLAWRALDRPEALTAPRPRRLLGAAPAANTRNRALNAPFHTCTQM